MPKKICPIDHKEIPFMEMACDYLTFMLEDALQEIVKESLCPYFIKKELI